MTENPINPAALYDYAASKNDMDSLRPEERTFLEACAWEWERLIDHGAEEWGKQFEALGIKPGVPQAPSAKPTPAAPEKPAPSSPAAERADEGLEEEAERLREAYTNDEGSWLEWPDCRQEPWLRVARAARALRRGGVTEAMRTLCWIASHENRSVEDNRNMRHAAETVYAEIAALDSGASVVVDREEWERVQKRLADSDRFLRQLREERDAARADAERLRGERDEARKEIQSTYRGVQQMMEAALGRTLGRSENLVQPDFPSLAAELARLRTAAPTVAVTDVEKAAKKINDRIHEEVGDWFKKIGFKGGGEMGYWIGTVPITDILRDCTSAASVEEVARAIHEDALNGDTWERIVTGNPTALDLRRACARAALRALGVREAEKAYCSGAPDGQASTHLWRCEKCGEHAKGGGA